jgi:hypothetical protein
MRRAFSVAVRFGHLQLFESENIVAMIMPPQFGIEEHHLLVEVYRPMPMEQIPVCVFGIYQERRCFPRRICAEVELAGANQRMKLTGAAILASRAIKVLQAAPAACSCRLRARGMRWLSSDDTAYRWCSAT